MARLRNGTRLYHFTRIGRAPDRILPLWASALLLTVGTGLNEAGVFCEWCGFAGWLVLAGLYCVLMLDCMAMKEYMDRTMEDIEDNQRELQRMMDDAEDDER